MSVISIPPAGSHEVVLRETDPAKIPRKTGAERGGLRVAGGGVRGEGQRAKGTSGDQVRAVRNSSFRDTY